MIYARYFGSDKTIPSSSVKNVSFHACADRGLVQKGRPNLVLVQRLYWLIVTSFILVGQTIFPINALILGTFPEEGIAGRICLLRDSSEKVNDIKGVRVRKLLFAAFGFLGIFFPCYFLTRVYRFLRRLCPNNRMSCIGVYKRNVLNLIQTCLQHRYLIQFLKIQVFQNHMIAKILQFWMFHP